MIFRKFLFFSKIIFLFNVYLFSEYGVLVIDDFEGKDLFKNCLGKNIFTSVFPEKSIFNLRKDGSLKNWCLKIEYNLNPSNYDVSGVKSIQLTNDGRQNIVYEEKGFFGGYFTEVQGVDFTKYSHLILYVKGDTQKRFTRRLVIELRDEKLVGRYILEGINSEWQKFLVPIKAFSGSGLKLSEVKLLGIVFPSDVVTSKEGVIYIDDILLAKRSFIKQEKIKINNTKFSLDIDGEFSEWSNERWYNITPLDNLEFGSAKDLNDVSGSFSLCWDKDFLYFSIKVKDNEIVCRELEHNLWRDDCIEIYLDPDNDGLIWGNEKDFQIGISPSGPESEPQIYAFFQNRVPTNEEIFYKVQRYKRGYNIEMAIKFDFLGLVPGKNRKFGFSVSINDVDTKESSSAKLSYCWVREKDRILLSEISMR